MKRIRRDNLFKRTAAILGNNEGASLVLVAIIAIIVLTSVVALRVATTTFMASANRQYNQDQAYELSASLGASIDVLISEGKIDLDDYKTSKDGIYRQHRFAKVAAPNDPTKDTLVADIKVENGVKKVVVTASVGTAEYVYTKEDLP